jgi:hypothetical protein
LTFYAIFVGVQAPTDQVQRDEWLGGHANVFSTRLYEGVEDQYPYQSA